jgi:hypothetical protein
MAVANAADRRTMVGIVEEQEAARCERNNNRWTTAGNRAVEKQGKGRELAVDHATLLVVELSRITDLQKLLPSRSTDRLARSWLTEKLLLRAEGAWSAWSGCLQVHKVRRIC